MKHVFTTVDCPQTNPRAYKEGTTDDTPRNKFPKPKVLRTTLHQHETLDMTAIPPPTDIPQIITERQTFRTDTTPANKLQQPGFALLPRELRPYCSTPVSI